jgi:hypothetical protein
MINFLFQVIAFLGLIYFGLMLVIRFNLKILKKKWKVSKERMHKLEKNIDFKNEKNFKF